MPQMMPLNWIFLYLMFLIIFFIFNFMNYYLFPMKTNLNFMKKMKNKTMNWKW
uniref:ATP synthase complex subunit 8 n=1 Tax=Limbodessus palmulaoides TaxID=985783 RepID=A0A343W9X2_9DYTI|nr:ATP synthase F0 subunit 8 [Limbodessus palmulaoides]AVZ66437.1 ATP synthase F0 subunit 8 [Limbodessus palmulaoides]